MGLQGVKLSSPWGGSHPSLKSHGDPERGGPGGGGGGEPASLDRFVEMQPAGRRAVVSDTLAPFHGEAAPPPLTLTSGKEAEAGLGIASSSSSSSASASCLLPGTQLNPDLKPGRGCLLCLPHRFSNLFLHVVLATRWKEEVVLLLKLCNEVRNA